MPSGSRWRLTTRSRAAPCKSVIAISTSSTKSCGGWISKKLSAPPCVGGDRHHGALRHGCGEVGVLAHFQSRHRELIEDQKKLLRREIPQARFDDALAREVQSRKSALHH